MHLSSISFAALHSAWPLFSLSSIYVCLFPRCSVFVVSQAKSARAKKRMWMIDEAYSGGTSQKNTWLPCSDCAFVYRYTLCIVHVVYIENKYCIGSSMCLLHRETWPLKPPEVHEAVLQFAGWGPRGEQLVRRPYPRDYTLLILARWWRSVRFSLASQRRHSGDLWFATVDETNVVAIRGLCAP